MASHWIEDEQNSRLVEAIRNRIADDNANVFIFLGAGLSFGFDRGRVLFEAERHDDGRRFPSWPMLVNRMRHRLESLPELKEHTSEVKLFFEQQSPIDCAELFREKVGTANYYDFLREQFVTKETDSKRLTASHRELTRLPVKTIFTTNFDELIELAFRSIPSVSRNLRVSRTPDEFSPHRQDRGLRPPSEAKWLNRPPGHDHPLPHGFCQGTEGAHGDAHSPEPRVEVVHLLVRRIQPLGPQLHVDSR